MSHLTSPQSLTANREGLVRIARSLVGNQADAEDLVQESLVAALESEDVRSPDAWLKGTTRRMAWKHLRGKGRRRTRERAAARPEHLPAADEVAAAVEIQRNVLDALEALEPIYRTTLWMRYFQDVPPRRIAAAQGVPVATVKTRLHRGLERLRLELDRRHGGDRRTWLSALVLGMPQLRAARPLPVVVPVLIAVLAVGAFIWIVAGYFARNESAAAAESVAAAQDDAQASLAGRGARRTSAVASDTMPVAPAAAQPAATARLAVELVDRGPRTFRKGTVEVICQDGSRRTTELERGDTATFESLPMGWTRVRLTPGTRLTAAEQRLHLSPGFDNEVSLRVESARPLHGEVRDASTGQPIAGASVRIVRRKHSLAAASADTWQAVSDEQGRFTVADAPWSHPVHVIAEASGYAVGSTGFHPRGAPGTDAVVQLERGGTVRGRVVGSDGEPVAGAIVYAKPSNRVSGHCRIAPRGTAWRPMLRSGTTVTMYECLSDSSARTARRVSWVRACRTDEDGRYDLTGLELETSYALGAAAQDVIPATTQPLLLTAAQSDVRRDLALRAPGILRIAIRDSAGQPVDRGVVWIGKGDWTPIMGPYASRPLPVGPRSVLVRSEAGVWHGSLDVRPRGAPPHEIQLATGRVIEGVLVDAQGTPAAGRELVARFEGMTVRATMSAADGRFVLDRLPRAPITIAIRDGSGGDIVSSDALPPSQGEVRLELPDGPEPAVEGLTIRLVVPGSWVPPHRVRVAFPVDEPGIAGAISMLSGDKAWAAYSRGLPDASLHAVDEGEVHIERLIPAGRPLLLYADQFVPVRIEADAVATGTVEVTLEDALEASGTVVDTDGEAIPGVRFSAPPDRFAQLADGVTDRVGRFRIEHLPAGLTPIVFVAPGYAPKVMFIDASEPRAHRVVLERGYALRVRVRTEEGTPSAGQRLLVRRDPKQAPIQIIELGGRSGTELRLGTGVWWIGLEDQAPQRVDLLRGRQASLELVAPSAQR
ncbi:MAG: sigma-70 family RNA polymerase sigma factor [Planctomycetota bacterium]|nr:sigma-70 family RNA polymerase sigma factor [Planctomycetota bacterium]